MRAAACGDGRSPKVTSVINSTTLENSSSRGYAALRGAGVHGGQRQGLGAVGIGGLAGRMGRAGAGAAEYPKINSCLRLLDKR